MNILNTTDLEPEIVLLLCCARQSLGDSCQHQIQQLVSQNGLDWKKAIKMARFHRLLPLLHKVLLSMVPAELPDWVLAELHQYQLRNIGNAFSLVQELRAFLDILDTHHIKAITFKGPVTAVSAYGDLSLRVFGDLDLLVHPDDLLTLRDIAIKHGYTCDKLMAISERDCLAKLTPQEQAAYFQTQKEFSLFNPEKRIFLDIHQGILARHFYPLFDTRWIWNHTQMVEIGGKQVLSLTPEVQILVLCAQGAEDYWNQLGKICDVAMLMDKHPTLDWDHLLELSDDLDVLRRLLLGLSLVQNLYGVDLPESAQKKIQESPVIQTLVQEVQQNILLGKKANVDSRLTMRRVIHQFRLMADWRNRVYFVGDLMHPTLADMAAMPLPKSLFFFYYLFRPLRLVQEIFCHKKQNSTV
ncbi:nucleotidyltransferase domain-containing protein [Leptothoe spongobia]|uniref:Nucleotidyltransferase family protein n=1 Tax=Leptothoe spongobia TAU-MAC 1115 TaxID=1967444 RepID=A0A947DDT9_9CYAN|nr:nucleotidyltransferase family protein [Leptothoe spongobia]MBT9314734.1 nucleotidyltransferase family protein [Leptothoe spongobia TAU-MAC 1115]